MKWLASIVTAAVVAASAGPGQAQVVDKKALTLEGARQVIATAVGEARRLQAPGGVIAVVDDGGNLIALERLDGSFAAGPPSRSARRGPPPSSSGRPGPSRTSSRTAERP
jgi:fermentation-respiration switch protein FrsA (DUF1100 family)